MHLLGKDSSKSPGKAFIVDLVEPFMEILIR